jgi:hypothetical protein
MSFFKPKKEELDSKSIAIAVMYLDKAKYRLEKELTSGERTNEEAVWTAQHDIKCLENVIRHLTS